MLLHFNNLQEVLDFISTFAPVVSSNATTDLTQRVVPAERVAEIIAQLNFHHDSTFRNPNKITAIRLYRVIMGCSLKEAKDAIEATVYYKR